MPLRNRSWLRLRQYLLVLMCLFITSANMAAPCADCNTRQIFLQPWQLHSAKKVGIKAYFSRMHENYTHLILQWSRHGESEFWPENGTGWLKETLPKRSKLKVVFGLYHDPNYFKALVQSDIGLIAYLDQIRELHVAEAKKIIEQSPIPVAAWYLPEEIDDLNWHSEARRQILVIHLQKTREELAQLQNPQLQNRVPVYISVFFGGFTPPDKFANQLQLIQQQTGIVWLVQDGQGVLRENPPNTAAYLAAMAQTLPAASWKGIAEQFSEVVKPSGRSFCPISRAQSLNRQNVWLQVTGRSAEVSFALNHTQHALFGAKQDCEVPREQGDRPNRSIQFQQH